MNNQKSTLTNETGYVKKREWDNLKVNVKFKLSALWATMMMLYIYADIYSLYRPGHIDVIRSGMMGPFPVTQNALFLASILTAIPALMIFLSLAVTYSHHLRGWGLLGTYRLTPVSLPSSKGMPCPDWLYILYYTANFSRFRLAL